jgi:DNA-binding NarL/FixJ family response regulator
VPPSPGEERLAVLTQREREVLALVGEGLSNTEIADKLVVSPATARTHVSRAMVKLGARDRAQLVVIAYQTGLVDPHPPPDHHDRTQVGATCWTGIASRLA